MPGFSEDRIISYSAREVKKDRTQVLSSDNEERKKSPQKAGTDPP
jgi:hypothetical protein